MLFASLHSSKRKFATAQYVNRERFLFPYLHSLFVICSFIVHLLFVHCSSFLYLPVRLAPSFVRHLFVICSSFVRHLFVICSFIVCLFFICPCGSHRLLFVHFLSHLSVTTLPLLGRGLGRGYFLRYFIICSCGSHRLLITCPSCYDCLSCYDCSYDSHCGINSAFANYPIIYYLCPIVND